MSLILHVVSWCCGRVSRKVLVTIWIPATSNGGIIFPPSRTCPIYLGIKRHHTCHTNKIKFDYYDSLFMGMCSRYVPVCPQTRCWSGDQRLQDLHPPQVLKGVSKQDAFDTVYGIINAWQIFVAKTCRFIINDVEKLDDIQDGFSTLSACQIFPGHPTPIYNYILTPIFWSVIVVFCNSNTWPTKLLTPRSWKGELNNTQMVGTRLVRSGTHMVLHLPNADGGFGVTFNDITKDDAFYTTTSRFVTWIGTFTQERQGLWLSKPWRMTSRLSLTESSWSSPPLVLLRDIHSKLLTHYDCKEVCALPQSQGHVGAPGGQISQDQDGVSQHHDAPPLSLHSTDQPPQWGIGIPCAGRGRLDSARIPMLMSLSSRHRIGWHVRSSTTTCHFKTSSRTLWSRVTLNSFGWARNNASLPLRRTEMTSLEPLVEDVPRRILWFEAMSWLGKLLKLGLITEMRFGHESTSDQASCRHSWM